MKVCECMVIQQSDGSEMCRQCRGDIYACECPMVHSIRCVDHPENKSEPKVACDDECTNPTHDHFETIDGVQKPIRCANCGEPAHYDEDASNYFHNDESLSCWLHSQSKEQWRAEQARLSR